MTERNDNRSFSAVIAAAGLSSRMGDFKPLLPYGKSTILGSVIDAFQEAGAGEILVVCGHRGEELAEYVRRWGARPVFNPDYAVSGMFDSLKIGLHNLSYSTHTVFLTPGDVPRITTALVRRLLTVGTPWAVPVCSGKPAHPVMVRGEFLSQITAYQGEGGLRGALERIPGGGEYLWEDDSILLDADTPEDYRKLLAYL